MFACPVLTLYEPTLQLYEETLFVYIDCLCFIRVRGVIFRYEDFFGGKKKKPSKKKSKLTGDLEGSGMDDDGEDDEVFENHVMNDQLGLCSWSSNSKNFNKKVIFLWQGTRYLINSCLPLFSLSNRSNRLFLLTKRSLRSVN